MPNRTMIASLAIRSVGLLSATARLPSNVSNCCLFWKQQVVSKDTTESIQKQVRRLKSWVFVVEEK